LGRQQGGWLLVRRGRRGRILGQRERRRMGRGSLSRTLTAGRRRRRRWRIGGSSRRSSVLGSAASSTSTA
jgi:hypothetical protein